LQLGSVRRSAEGCNGKSHHLEALLAEGDTDNRYAEDNGGYKISDSDSESAKKNPENICYRVLAEIRVYGLTERKNRKRGDLDCLKPEGDTDNSYAPQKSKTKPRKSAPQSDKNEPYYVSQGFHYFSSFRFTYLSLPQKSRFVNEKIFSKFPYSP
jgi:hypothetical protein